MGKFLPNNLPQFNQNLIQNRLCHSYSLKIIFEVRAFNEERKESVRPEPGRKKTFL
jgi:hypothetical protein